MRQLKQHANSEPKLGSLNHETLGITVVVPTNRISPSVAQAVNLLFKQQDNFRQNIEILIIDNSITGMLHEYVESISRESPLSIRYFHEVRKGRAFAINAGVRHAIHPIITFLDDDMVISQDYLASIQREFTKDSELNILMGRVKLPEGYRWEIATKDHPDRLEFSYPCDPWKVGNGNGLTVKKEVFEKIGLFDTCFGGGCATTGEDTEFIYRALKKGYKVVYSPDVVSYHHHNRDSEDRYVDSFRLYGEGAGAFFMKYIFEGDIYSVRLLKWTVESLTKKILGIAKHDINADETRIQRKRSIMFAGSMVWHMFRYPFHALFNAKFKKGIRSPNNIYATS